MKTELEKIQDDAQEARKRKRAYVKPAYRYQAVFETMALSCGKLAGTTAQCNSVPKAS